MRVKINIKRAYDPPSPADGLRVLVDRLWPRGVTKESLRLDAWVKDLSPSDELRKRFHHDVSRWEEFRTQYLAHLRGHRPQLEQLLAQAAKAGMLTLVYAAKDTDHNNAAVLREALQEMQQTKGRRAA